MVSSKETNPKDAVGIKKFGMLSCVSAPVIMEMSVGMFEGARKYGRHNYRVSGVRASVYYDAAMRHLMAWYEGEDTDPDSGMHHVGKALACLSVLRDAQIREMVLDDRPPKTDWQSFVAGLQSQVDSIFERIPEAKAPFVEGDQVDPNAIERGHNR